MGRKSRALCRLVAPLTLILAVNAYPAADIGPDIWNNLDRTGEVGIIITLKGFEAAAPMPKSALSRLSASQDNLVSVLETEGFELRYRYSHLPIISGRANESVLLALYEREDVLAVEYDIPIKANLAQSVPLVQADYVRNTLGYTGSGVVVAIVDTGIDTDHPNLVGGRILAQYHFLNAGGDVGPGAEDDNGHGTNCAGVVGSSAAVGGFGMAPQCDFVALKVLKSDGAGWLSDWTAALNWIIANNGTLNISVINASLGSTALYTSDCSASQTAMATAVTTLRNMGVLLVASSGNDGDVGRMSAPACIGAAISVGASFDSNLGREPNSGTWLDIFGGSWPPCFDDPANAKQITCFTNRNFLLDFLAPGRPITSSYIGGSLATYTGTSQAAPHVAGLAALLLEADPTMTPDQLYYAMWNTGENIYDPLSGYYFRHINARDAVASVLDADGDGIPVATDNCPDVYNPGQEDTNNDDIGDACCCLIIRGNVNGDSEDKVNVSDVSYLVDYLFGIPSGEAPPCPNEGNANGDSEDKTNVSDVSYLIAYLFGIPSGPAPPSCP